MDIHFRNALSDAPSEDGEHEQTTADVMKALRDALQASPDLLCMNAGLTS